MSANLYQWLIILAFFVLVSGFTFAEAFWLSSKGWAGFGKSFVFSALSNFIGFTVGLIAFFVVLAVFMMFSLDGSLSRAIDSSFFAETAAIAIFVFAALLTPLLLITGKRVFLSVLKMQTGKAAWVFALASSVLIFGVSLGVPILLGYLIFR